MISPTGANVVCTNKLEYAPDGERIFYLPGYFNKINVPLKKTSKIIPITGFDGSRQALLIKPGANLYIQVNTSCNAKCPNCLLKYKGISVSKGCLPFSKKFFKALKFASEHMNIRNCSITGGEPSLLKERLIELVRILPKNFENITLFSNGSQLLSKINGDTTLLEVLISEGLTSLVLNCVHPNEKMRANFITPLVTNKEYYKMSEICKDNLIDVRLSWVFDNKDMNQNKTEEKIRELVNLGSYLNVPEMILRIPTTVTKSKSNERLKSRKLWAKCRKYLDNFSTPEVIRRSVKTRAYYKINKSILILEVYHEPKNMKTDAGTIMLFSGANPQEIHMSYRWYNGVKSYSINYESKPWAKRSFFRKAQRTEDPYERVLRELINVRN